MSLTMYCITDYWVLCMVNIGYGIDYIIYGSGSQTQVCWQKRVMYNNCKLLYIQSSRQM